MRLFLASTAALTLAVFLTLLHIRPASAAGVVTDCSRFGPGPGTLATEVATGGLVTFACSGTIIFPNQVIMLDVEGKTLVLDGSGQKVILSGGNDTRLFNVGPETHLHLHQVTLMDGNAHGSGGGAIQSNGYLTITNSALLSNTAAYGGAIEIYNGRVLIQNSTLAYNRALDSDASTGGGGAIDQYFVDQGDGSKPNEMPYLEIANSTIAGNSAAIPQRSGIWQENGRLVLKYSIVAHNGAGNCLIAPPNPGLQFFTIGSLDNDGQCRSAQQADPALSTLGDYGGGTPSFALLPNSPAIDAAPPDACVGTVDQRSLLRPRDGNRDGTPACDLGSYEYADRFMVLADAGAGLAGYWKFDEGGGAASMDSSGHGLTATLQPGASFTAGVPSLLFNAPYALQSSPAGGAQVGDAPPLNPQHELTLAAWLRLDGGSGVQRVAAKLQDAQDGPGYGLLVRDGTLSGEVWDSAGARHAITTEAPAGGWLHVALSYQAGGAMSLYVNGRRAATQAAGEPIAGSTAPLVMAVDGALDDVRLYSRGLAPGALAALAGGRPCAATGATWGEAMPDLQCALLESEAGAEVWVGPGIYRPTFGPDRTATFAIRDGVGVYGGFAGGESRRDERQPQTPRPVLSGDIGADDHVDAGGVLADPAALAGGNALHVVTISSTLTTTVLERMAITGGHADGAVAADAATCSDGCGGGLHIAGGSPQLKDLLLAGNQAADRGGGIYADQSNTLLISSTLLANQAGSGGGGYWRGGAPTIVNSLAGGNLAEEQGGGIYGLNSSMRLVNVTVGGNRAGARGGGIVLEGAGSTAANIVVGANLAPSDAQAGGDSVAAQASLIQDACPPRFACGENVLAGDPLFVAADAAAAPTSSGDYRLLPGSPAIDSGDNYAGLSPSVPEGATMASISADVAGEPRIVAARMLPARIDLGAYEALNTPPLFATEPITAGTTTIEYIYQVVAVDPNRPGERLPVEVVKRPEWLSYTPQEDGSGLLRGTPPNGWYGLFDVTLRSTDELGATSEQSFAIHVLQRVYSIFMPQVLR